MNGSVTINKIDYRSHRGNIIGYSATTEFILYCNPYQPFVIHRSYNIWFDEYNSRLSIEDNHTPGYLLL